MPVTISGRTSARYEPPPWATWRSTPCPTAWRGRAPRTPRGSRRDRRGPRQAERRRTTWRSTAAGAAQVSEAVRPEHDLDVLGHEVHGDVQRSGDEERRRQADREPSRSEEAGWQHRCGHPSLPDHEADARRRTDDHGCGDLPTRPPGGGASRQRPHDSGRCRRDEDEADDVDAVIVAVGLVDHGEHDRDRGERSAR